MALSTDRVNFSLLVLSLLWSLNLAAGCSTHLERSSLHLPPDTTPEQVLHNVDRIIKLHAFQALLGSRAGTVYDVPLPVSLQPGIQVQVVRLHTARLHRWGFIFNEIVIPPGVSVTVSGLVPEYVVFVYRLFSMGVSVYCPDNGLQVIGPVVGVKAYSSYPLGGSAEVVAEKEPMAVRVPLLSSDSNRMCALFDGDGSTTVTSMTDVDICFMQQLEDATVVIFSPENSTGSSVTLTWSPEQAPSPRRSYRKLKLAVVTCTAVAASFLLGAFAVILGVRAHQAGFVGKMECHSDENESLEHTFVSQSFRPPRARIIRTQAAIERDYIFK